MGMDVIVVGAGYAGLLAAHRLSRRVAVTLVDRRNVSVDRIRLHQLAAGTFETGRVVRPLGHLNRRLSFVACEVAEVCPGVVRLADGRELRARHVLVACGRGARRVDSVEDLEGAMGIRSRLAVLDSGTVRVVGAGLTGVETAAEVAAATGSSSSCGATAHRRVSGKFAGRFTFVPVRANHADRSLCSSMGGWIRSSGSG